MRIINFFKLIICIAISELAGVVGSIFTVPSISNWYATLQKPLLNPPGWVFGPVWIILYLLMGISLWLILASDSKEKKKATWLFFVQLTLNAAWSPVFFGGQSIGAACVVIVLLWVAIVSTIFIFTKISKTAAWLFVPYIIWVSFATYLNFALWVLN